MLDQVAQERGYPRKLRSDNGPELVGKTLAAWADKHRVELAPIQLGKPTQNAYIERFNRTYRQEVLDLYAFGDLDEVRNESTRWVYDYYHDEPHLALNRQTPAGHLARYQESVRPAEPFSRSCAPPSGLGRSTPSTNKEPQTLYLRMR